MSELLNMCLLRAARDGKTGEVETLLKEGAEVNAFEKSYRQSPLALAVEKGHIDIAETLIDLGANVNKTYAHKDSALSIAAMKGDLAIAKMLISNGADVNSTDKHRNTAVTVASASNHLHMVAFLISKGAKLNEEHERGSNRSSALSLASKNGHFQISELLISKGANVDSFDNDGHCALALASKNGHLKIVKLLISKGAKLNVAGLFAWNALQMASEQNRARVVEMLIKEGAELNFPRLFSESPVYLALQSGHSEVADLLIKAGADVHVTDHIYGVTALHLAARNGLINAVGSLIEKGVDVNALDKPGHSPLHLASEKGHTRVVEMLIANGAEVNATTKSGLSALSYASKNGNGEVMAVLIADILSERSKRQAALEIAVQREEIEVLEHLLFNGVAERLDETWLNFRDFHGRSMLYFAVKEQRGIKYAWFYGRFIARDFDSQMMIEASDVLMKFIYEELINYGETNVGIVLDSNITVLGYACKNGHINFIRQILSATNVKLLPDLLNFGNPSPFWLAVNSDHLEIVKLLLQWKDMIDVNKKAPDGTTALMMALAKEHFEIVDEMNNIFPPCVIRKECRKFGKHSYLRRNKTLQRNENRHSCAECNASADVKVGNRKRRNTSMHSSTLVTMSQQFPLYNEKVEARDWEDFEFVTSRSEDRSIRIDREIGRIILSDFCIVEDHLRKNSHTNVIFLSDVDKLFECNKQCNKKQDCTIISDLLTTCSLLEKALNSSSSTMSPLQPQFILCGSVAEGTRLKRASEIDITLQFKGLMEIEGDSGKFDVRENAMKLLLPKVSFMSSFCTDETNHFDYPKFLFNLLNSIKKGLENIVPGLPKRIKLNMSFEFCSRCKALKKRKLTHEPWTHCSEHFPSVTHTKLGPCLIFQWKDNNIAEPMVVAVDLVPVFPIKEHSVVDLYNNVIRTLVDDEPTGWLDYFNCILKRDIILPEAFAEQQKSNPAPLQIAIKLLNYGPRNNYIIRPAQEMAIQNFQKMPKQKEIYLYMKALEYLLKVGAKSYFMKKVLMLEDFKQKVNDPNSRLDELLYHALSNRDLKRLFQNRIDYVEWEAAIARNKMNLEPGICKDIYLRKK